MVVCACRSTRVVEHEAEEHRIGDRLTHRIMPRLLSSSWQTRSFFSSDRSLKAKTDQSLVTADRKIQLYKLVECSVFVLSQQVNSLQTEAHQSHLVCPTGICNPATNHPAGSFFTITITRIGFSTASISRSLHASSTVP